MEIIIQIAIVIVVFFLLKSLWKKYIQWQVVKKYKQLLSTLKEEDKKISINDFLTFLSNNIDINQDAFFKEKLTEFINLYSNGYKNGISTFEIFLCWITRIKYDILFVPDKGLSINEYQNIYERENKNVFEKIEYQNKTNIRDEINDQLLKSRLFYLRLNNTIELFLNKQAKESDSLFPFYWFPFSNLFLKNLYRINYKTWFIIESLLNENANKK